MTAALETFLPRLAEAYGNGDLERLRGMAAAGEIAAVGERVAELAAAGETLEVTFRRLTIEHLTSVSRSTIQVITVETWDVRLLTAGTDELLRESLGENDRVRYQLKRTGDGWLVVSRTIQ